MRIRSERYLFRKLRVRNKIRNVAHLPRLSVYRSLKHIYAQIIDDAQGKTLVAASSREKGIGEGSGVKVATLVGSRLGEKATQKGINQVVFDRGGRPYHGRVKAVAEGARQAGLKI
ncbi:MAG: 50S ribosomal protein L18 [Elusimicrobia bacterium]|nr:50S ribosomal protein L18 [Elusimicrobiota bacterium]